MTNELNYILESKNVNVYYGELHALKDINLKIQKNSVTALIGPSGCGKSTFLRVFNRMNDYIDSFKIEGEVFMEGQNIYDKKVRVDELRKNIGMVFVGLYFRNWKCMYHTSIFHQKIHILYVIKVTLM